MKNNLKMMRKSTIFFSIQTLLVKEDFHSHPSTMAKATEATTNNNKTLVKVETDNVVNNYQIIFRLKTTHKLSFLLGLWFGYFILRQQIFMDTSAWMMTKIRGILLFHMYYFLNLDQGVQKEKSVEL